MDVTPVPLKENFDGASERTDAISHIGAIFVVLEGAIRLSEKAEGKILQKSRDRSTAHDALTTLNAEFFAILPAGSQKTR